MKPFHISLTAIAADGTKTECELFGALSERRECQLKLSFGKHIIEESSNDFFDALCKVRKILESNGVLLLCYGASRNVFPSAMSRDMGLGYVAYKTKLGQPGSREDLVEIFASGPDVEPVTVNEQAAWHLKWMNSLQRK